MHNNGVHHRAGRRQRNLLSISSLLKITLTTCMWLKGVNSESQAYALEFCSHIYIESLPYNEGLTVYNTNSLQVYKLRVLYIDNIFRLKCEKYLHRAFIGFPQHTEENIEFFFFSCKDKLCMKATLNITRRECVSVRDEHLTVTHAHRWRHLSWHTERWQFV